MRADAGLVRSSQGRRELSLRRWPRQVASPGADPGPEVPVGRVRVPEREVEAVGRALLAAGLLLLAPLAAPPPTPAAGGGREPVRGWLVHNPDRAYLARVLAAAPRYHVNHLELSHGIVMQADEAPEPERARLIE